MKLKISSQISEFYNSNYNLYKSGLVALFKHSDSNLKYNQFRGYLNIITIFGK